jgi:hypothetical protein
MADGERPLITADLAEQRAPEGASDTTATPAETGSPGEDVAEAGGDVNLAGGRADAGTQPLLDEEQTGGYRRRWEQIQTAFVDEPRRAVQDADTLVAEVMQRLAETFARARGDLEGQWSRGGEVGTEELRVALQRYRSFFEVLLRR